jgi:uncharacterized protein (TIGR02118 family)
MLKLVMCVKRLPQLTREQFDLHWRDRHGPLVRSHMEVLRIRRYVQTLALDDPLAQDSIRASRGALKAEFDGCAELWWDSSDELAAARETAEGRAALRQLLDDERRFLDLPRSQLWWGVERQIIPAK